jgi:hypothetical protein
VHTPLYTACSLEDVQLLRYIIIYLFAFMYMLQSLLHRCWIVIVSDIVHLPCKGVAIL